MTIYRSDSDKALRHQKSLQQGIVDWSSPFLIVSLLLAIGYFVTNQGALGILAILLFAKEAYFRPISPTHAASVEIELQEASFIYRELNSSYQVTIDYDRVKSVQIKYFDSFPSVQIEIDQQAELGCLYISQAEDLAKELAIRAKL